MKVGVAGGSGQLGRLIVKHLIKKGAAVRVIVRPESAKKALKIFANQKVEIVEAIYDNPLSLVDACVGVDCVVSALSGPGEVIIDGQTKLLGAAIEAGVKKFIPSDFCIDYRRLQHGNNRNLDLRREFSKVLDSSQIKATSVLNGMFMDLLNNQAPVVLHKHQRILLWGNPDQKMDFTTMDNAAEYTAFVVMDHDTPRWLMISGETASARHMQTIASRVTGKKFKLLRPGGLALFKILIKITKTIAPGKKETFPAWQGMQYLYDMLSGLPKFHHLDNYRYKGIRWRSIAEVIGKKESGSRRYTKSRFNQLSLPCKESAPSD